MAPFVALIPGVRFVRHDIIDIGGPVHWVDFGGDGPPMVLVHGLSGTFRDWLLVARSLTRRHRVIAVDLLGFGETPLHRASTIRANAELVATLVQQKLQAPAIWMGNSMGGLISAVAAAKHPETVGGAVLVDPSVPLPSLRAVEREILWSFAVTAMPGLGEWVVPRWGARIGPEKLVRDVMERCCVDTGNLPPWLMEEAVAFVRRRVTEHPWASRAHVGAARSLVALILRRRSFHKLMQRVRAPVLVVHGQGDRLVPISAARALVACRPDWMLEELEGVGHIPHLEAPRRFLQVVSRWLRAGMPQRIAADEPAPELEAGTLVAGAAAGAAAGMDSAVV